MLPAPDARFPHDRLLAAGPAHVETIAGDRITVIDGDTVTLRCTRLFPGSAEEIRLLNVNAPEFHSPSCSAELRGGIMAMIRLTEIIKGEDVAIQRSGMRDRYGRTLAVCRRRVSMSV